MPSFLSYLTFTGFKYQMDLYSDKDCKKKFAYLELISKKVVASPAKPNAGGFGGFDIDVDVHLDSIYVTLYGVSVTLVTLLCPKTDGTPWVEGKRAEVTQGCPAIGLPSTNQCPTLYGMLNWKPAADSESERLMIASLIQFGKAPSICAVGSRNRVLRSSKSNTLFKYADAPRITVFDEPIFADPATKPKPPKKAPVDGTKPTKPVDTDADADADADDGTGTPVAKPWTVAGISASEGVDNNGDTNDDAGKKTADGNETGKPGASKGKGKGNGVDWSAIIVIIVGASAVLFLAFNMHRKRSEAAHSVSRLQSIPTANDGGGDAGGASLKAESGALSGKRITLNPMSEMPGVKLTSMSLHD
jgi:hypothetical protein